MSFYHIIAVAAVTGGFAFFRPRWAIALTIIAAPVYLVKLVIRGVPITLLEAMILGTVVGWCLKTVLEILYDRVGVVSRIRSAVGVVPRWAWYGLALVGVGWILATIRSVDVTASLGALKAWLIEPLLFGAVVLYELRSDNRCKKTIERSLLLSLIWVSLAGLVQLAFFRQTVEDGRLSSVFSPVANYFAMFAAPLIVYAFGLFVAGRDRVWSAAAVLAGGLALFFSVSYGGFFAVAAGAVAVLVFVLPSRHRRRALISLAIAVVIGFVALLPTRHFREKINFSTRSSSLVRTEIWRTAIEIGIRHPFSGIGPNTFETEYRRVAPELFHPPLEWLVAKPHNLYLNAWVETGALGALGLFMLLGGFLANTLRGVGSDRVGACLVGAATVAIAAHGFVDTPLFKNDLALVGVVFAAIGLIAASPEKTDGK